MCVCVAAERQDSRSERWIPMKGRTTAETEAVDHTDPRLSTWSHSPNRKQGTRLTTYTYVHTHKHKTTHRKQGTHLISHTHTNSYTDRHTYTHLTVWWYKRISLCDHHVFMMQISIQHVSISRFCVSTTVDIRGCNMGRMVMYNDMLYFVASAVSSTLKLETLYHLKLFCHVINTYIWLKWTWLKCISQSFLPIWTITNSYLIC